MAPVGLTRAAFVVVTAVMVLSGRFGVAGVGSTSYEVSACPRTTRFLLASNFLEARAGGARCARITGESRAESVSNKLELYALYGGKREEL